MCGVLQSSDAQGQCAPHQPYSVSDVPIEFFSDHSPGGRLRLVGTLSVPQWKGEPPARRPGILLLHGSGPQSRAGRISGDIKGRYAQPVPVLKDLARALGERGYTVLRYDKRTCTARADPSCVYSAESARAATWADLVGDVRAAARALRKRPEVTELIVVGHSQGGTLALETLGDTEPSALVLLAGTHSPIQDVIGRQLVWLAQQKAPQLSVKERALAQAQVQAALRTLEEIAAGRAPAGQVFLNAPASFWRGWMASSAQTDAWLTQYTGPLLYMGGGDDVNVDDVERLRYLEALSRRQEGQAVILPELSHALHRRHGPGRVDPAVVEMLLEWLEER